MIRSEQLGRADDWWTSINNQPEGIKVPGVYRKDTVFFPPSIVTSEKTKQNNGKKKNKQQPIQVCVRLSVCVRAASK